jgi:hypothetical protein
VGRSSADASSEEGAEAAMVNKSHNLSMKKQMLEKEHSLPGGREWLAGSRATQTNSITMN